MKSADMMGFESGRLRVVEYAGQKDGKALWKCKCICGGVCYHTTTDLKSRQPQSCGCLQKELARELVVKAGRKRVFEGGSCLNAYSAGLSDNNTSGVKGVSFHKKSEKWRAQIKYAGKNYYLGLYADMKEAAMVRMDAEEFIKENFNKPELIVKYFDKLKKT